MLERFLSVTGKTGFAFSRRSVTQKSFMNIPAFLKKAEIIISREMDFVQELFLLSIFFVMEKEAREFVLKMFSRARFANEVIR
jgi:exosome complex RNA-binding protein Csl4